MEAANIDSTITCSTLGPSVNGLLVQDSYNQPLRELYGSACYCNKLADDLEPEVCHVVCSSRLYSPDCLCKNYLLGGKFCEEKICKNGGQTFCASIPVPSPCDDNVNADHMDDFPYCPCSSAGNLTEGICVCDEKHSGRFCENYLFRTHSSPAPSHG